MPNAICQNTVIELDNTGNTSTTAAAIDNGSTDNCGVAGTILDITAFECDDVGTNAVVLTVTDIHSNSSTGTATVTVEDNNPDADTDGIEDPCDTAFDIGDIVVNTNTYIDGLSGCLEVIKMR